MLQVTEILDRNSHKELDNASANAQMILSQREHNVCKTNAISHTVKIFASDVKTPKSCKRLLRTLITFLLILIQMGNSATTFGQGCPLISNNSTESNGICTEICFFDYQNNSLGACLECQLVNGTWNCGAAFDAYSNYYKATIGGIDCFNTNDLGITISAFQATSSATGVEISWVSQSESYTDYYTLEKSVNGVDFFEVHKVNCVGSYSSEKIYTMADERAIVGTNYYRLSQTNFDGVKTVIETISFVNKSSDDVTIYPNPVSATEVSFSFTHVTSYDIVTSTGQVLFSGTAHDNMVNVSQFSNGIYYVQFTFKNGNTTEKLLLVSK
jgi:hypothetical protein